MDNGNSLNIIFEANPFQTGLESKSDMRVVLGYVSMRYITDTDLTLTIYARRDDEMEWESVATITIDHNEKRLSEPLPSGLSVIDYYPVITGSPSYVCEIYSLKIHQKILQTGNKG